MKLALLACCALPLAALAIQPRGLSTTQDDGPREAEAAPEAPTIAVAGMLEGTWIERRTQASGTSIVEELWSAPRGDNVIGAFRWLSPDGSAAMHEILVITAEADGIFLRLRHFGPDLVAWEERDRPKTLRLAEHGAERLVFRAHAHCADMVSVTYDRTEEDVLAVEVAFEAEGGRPPLRFRLERAE